MTVIAGIVAFVLSLVVVFFAGYYRRAEKCSNSVLAIGQADSRNNPRNTLRDGLEAGRNYERPNAPFGAPPKTTIPKSA